MASELRTVVSTSNEAASDSFKLWVPRVQGEESASGMGAGKLHLWQERVMCAYVNVRS